MLELLASQPEHQAAVKAVWSRALAGEEFVEIGEFGDPARDRRVLRDALQHAARSATARASVRTSSCMTSPSACATRSGCGKAEEALRQAQKLESHRPADRRRGARLQQPAGRVRRTACSCWSATCRRSSGSASCAAMRRAVARGTGLTHQLLAFSRRQAINPESIDLAAHLKGMRDMLERSLRGDIRVEMDFGAELWPVEIDVGEFELAMLNLFANARDAMPGGGTISIDAGNLKESGDDGVPTDFVQLSVADTGSGMPPEVLDRVLRAILHDQGRRQGIGTGIAAGLRFRAAIRRSTHDRQPGRRGHDRDAAAAALVAQAGGAGRRVRRARARAQRWRARSPRAARRRRRGSRGAHARDAESPGVHRHSRGERRSPRWVRWPMGAASTSSSPTS